MVQSSAERRTEWRRVNDPRLDWLNFFLADVKDGVGPFLAIYLTTSQHWDAAHVGIVLSVAGIATVVARGPAGALVDAIHWKQTLIVLCALTVAAASIAMALAPQFWPVVLAQAVTGVVDALFPLAITAISLGIVGRRRFTERTGRNEAWNHGGNVATAVLAGGAGYAFGPVAVLWMIAALATVSIVVVQRIDADAIDHDVARGDSGNSTDKPEGIGDLLRHKPLLWFTAAITLFHFANAAMLPLAGQKLARGHDDIATLVMAACIIAAQLVMVPMAMIVGRKADDWGRKPLFLVAFLSLPIRGLLFTLADNPYAMIAIQLLDGVGAGIFGALFYVVVADLTKGSGRFNLALGLSSACWGLGAALSNGVAGFVVTGAGYAAAFGFLSACAAGALAIYWLCVPETKDYKPAAQASGKRVAASTGTR